MVFNSVLHRKINETLKLERQNCRNKMKQLQNKKMMENEKYVALSKLKSKRNYRDYIIITHLRKLCSVTLTWMGLLGVRFEVAGR